MCTHRLFASATTLAFYLSHFLDSYTRGFGYHTIFLIIIATMIFPKKGAVEKFIAGMAIMKYFEKHFENQQNDAQASLEPLYPM